ncbi:MAG TPA: IS256 family transposase [bacterium]|nr:IS256 family transposase [bacterium]
MASVTALTDLTVADLWKEVKDEATVWGDVSQATLRTVKLLLENRMHDELINHLNARRYVRDLRRCGYRNGVYRRRLVTTWGTIPDLHVPRARHSGFQPSVLSRYQRRTRDVNTLVRAAFLSGVSTRQVGPLLAQLLDDLVSPTTVSTITQTLDHAVAAFHHRRLPDAYQYLFLDAVSLRVKSVAQTKRRLILVAYGIRSTGQRELIDFRVVRYETQATWEAFLTTLACRGLVGNTLQLITTDGHRGLHAALDLVYSQVPRQACWVHVLRNVATRLRAKDREACLRMARQIYLAPTAHVAERRLRAWVAAWQRTAPTAVACLTRESDALLAFYTVAEADWRRVRTTNAIERVFREVRRRTRPMTCFTNVASCERIVYAIFQATNRRQARRSPSREFTQKT